MPIATMLHDLAVVQEIFFPSSPSHTDPAVTRRVMDYLLFMNSKVLFKVVWPSFRRLRRAATLPTAPLVCSDKTSGLLLDAQTHSTHHSLQSIYKIGNERLPLHPDRVKYCLSCAPCALQVRHNRQWKDHRPVMIHVNYHPDKHERMIAIVQGYINGKQDALQPFPDGSE